MIMLITPHVIQTHEKLQEMSQELKDSLRNVRKLVDEKKRERAEDLQDAQKDKDTLEQKLPKEEKKQEKKEQKKEKGKKVEKKSQISEIERKIGVRHLSTECVIGARHHLFLYGRLNLVRGRNSPPPGRPMTLLSRAITFPRCSTSHVAPRTFIPSYGV